MSTTDHVQQDNPLLPIFALRQKSELVDYCAGLEVTNRDLLEIVLRARAGDFGNYNYAAHIVNAVPDTIPLSRDDLRSLSSTPVGGALTSKDKQLVKSVFLEHDSTKVFAAHMFYTSDWVFWYAFCFDKHDKGSRISLITDHFRVPLEDVWAKIVAGSMDFPKLSITFKQ